MTLCSSGKYSRSDDLLYLAQAFSGYLLETEINQLQSMLNKAKNGHLVSISDDLTVTL